MEKRCSCGLCGFNEDWEATGQEEMNEICEKVTEKKSILDVRDRLNNLLELVIICREALTESSLIKIQEHVANVMYFHVEEQLRITEQELKNI